MTTIRSILVRAILIVAASMLALVALELTARHLDGYPLLRLRLPPGFPPSMLRVPPPPPSLAAKASSIAADAETDPAWIDEPLMPLANRQPPDPELLELRGRLAHSDVSEFDLYNVWNRKVAEERGCTDLPVLSKLPMPLRAFEPIEDTRFPPYRYYQSRTTPLGLVTNAFGFRGPDIPLNKPAGTIRIAFIGASTTVGSYDAPFSYPEYVVAWLNGWAERTHRAVHFDLVNAGRLGMTSEGIAAIVRQEVLPLEPDLLVYYEGSNQFIFADNLAGDEFPILGRPKSRWESFVETLGPYSALVGRVSRGLEAVQGEAGEPTKPKYTLQWPEGVNFGNPDIRRPNLPLDLPRILTDLRSIRDAAATSGAELAVSSFVFFVRDGLRLSPYRDAFVYDWLNNRCWPYTYADLRRLADFQNRVFERFADEENLLFVDLARSYPDERQWFFDAIHFTNDGIRLQAWLVMQSLLPRIRERIAAGTWPRPDREALAAHPNLRGYRDLVLPCAHQRPADH